MIHCVNKNSPQFIELQRSTGLHPAILSAKIAVWQKKNGLENFPKLEEIISSSKPYIVWHSSDQKIDKFISENVEGYFAKVKKGSPKAVFFTANKPPEESFLSKRKYQEQFGVRMDNPLIVDTKEGYSREKESFKELVDRALAGNHDGVIVRNVNDNQFEGDIYISLDANKISKTFHSSIADAIREELPREIHEAITYVEEVPLDVLGREDILLSIKNILNENGIEDEILINWIGINKNSLPHPKAIKSEQQVLDIIQRRLDKRRKEESYSEFKTNELALESFRKWVEALKKYPLPFQEVMLNHAIKWLINPQRRSKYVLQLSNVALQNAYGIVVNKPHELNRIGKLYDQEVLRTVSDATKHEPAASGNGYWVHVPRTSFDNFLGFDSYYEFVLSTESSIEINENYINSLEEKLSPDYYEKISKELEELENKPVVFKSQEPNLTREKANEYGFQDFVFIRVESSYSRGENKFPEFLGKNYEGYYIHGYNTEEGMPKRKAVPITKEQAEEIWNEEKERYPEGSLEVEDRQQIFRLKSEIKDYNPEKLRKRLKEGKDKLHELKEKLKTVKPSDWEGKDNAYYKSNVELLRKLSPSTWCTAGSNAEYYVQNYDNYLLIVDGITVAGIEAGDVGVNGKVQVKEVTSKANNGIAPIDYIEDIIAFFEKHNLDTRNNSLRRAINIKEGKASYETYIDADEWADQQQQEMAEMGIYNWENQEDPPDRDPEEEREFMENEVEAIDTLDEALDKIRLVAQIFHRLRINLRNNENVAREAVLINGHNITLVDKTLPFYDDLLVDTITKTPYLFRYLDEDVKEAHPELEEIYKNYEEQNKDDDLPFSRTIDNRVQGYYDPKSDKVVIVTSNTLVEEASKVAIHEVAHRGMIRMAKELGGSEELFEALLSSEKQLMEKLPELLERTGHISLEELILDYGFDINTRDGKFKLLMELAARWAETLVNRPKPSWWKELLEKIKNWITRFTGKTLTEEEVNELVGGFVKYGTQNINKKNDRALNYQEDKSITFDNNCTI